MEPATQKPTDNPADDMTFLNGYADNDTSSTSRYHLNMRNNKALVVRMVDISQSSWYMFKKSHHAIPWIAIYPVDSIVLHLSNNSGQNTFIMG